MRVAFLLSITVFGLFGQSNQDVQAFVPNMNWLKRVEPVFPEEARSQRLIGAVQLLVTLDSNGLVTAAEPLTGRPVFRQAAADAIAHWQFQPVIRNGRPVPALTTASVIFRLPGEKITPESMGSNLTEEKAAADRMHELELRFPRSPEQVLTDLEQSLEGAPPLERFLHLPQLAIAALQAGDLNKATAYARESLDSSAQPKSLQRNGNGVHDGNMVLGLVALKGGDIAAARQYLLEAGKTVGSPTLNSFGPNMTLAKGLLDAGERDVVLDYFAECRVIWKLGSKQLDDWSATIRGGGLPEFGANLVY